MQIDGVSTPLRLFASVVDAFCARDTTADADVDITTELQLERTLINRMELHFARTAARFASTYDEEVDVNPSAVSWLREHCNMTSHAAATAVTVGELGTELTRTTSAVAEGRVGFAHLGLIAELARALDGSGARARFDEGRLLHRAEVLSVQRFRTLCSHVRHEADRDAFLRDQLAERECRTLEMKPCGDGVSLTAFLDAEGGCLFRTAIEALAARDGAADFRSRPQRQADALVELCAHALDTGAVPQRASQRTHLQVTTSLDTLLGLAGAPAGETEHGALLAGATVQRLACDATITRVLINADSQVVDVGRSQRVVGSATRRALNVRDKGCRWPGCQQGASWTAAHHVVHWVRDGRTDAANLVLLCHRHHWLVHEGGWQLFRADDGAVYTVSPLAGDWIPLRYVPGQGTPAPDRAPSRGRRARERSNRQLSRAGPPAA